MKAVVTRVSSGKVVVADRIVAAIKNGLAIFVGLEKGDTIAALTEIADKIANLRIFEDADGKLQFSVKDKNSEVLCVSNFTLSADLSSGRRPSFDRAMPKAEAQKTFEDFCVLLRAQGLVVRTGEFGARMDIDLVMDGPVNIIVDRR